MSFFETMETAAETAQEFTPEQMEAQEAMQEAGEMANEVGKEAGENTPEYWSAKAEKELNENGESDAYREYIAKANIDSDEETMVGGFWAGYTSKEWLDKAADALAQGRPYDAQIYKQNAVKAM